MGFIYGIKYIGDKSLLTARSKNTLSGKYCYIGQSQQDDYNKRWKQEKDEVIKGSKNSLLYDTIRHHGIEKFVWELLLIVDDESIDKVEDEYICRYSLSPNGLNLRRGGARGKATAELCAKLSFSMKKRFESLEAREKNRKAQKEAYANPELREKQRNIRLVLMQTPRGKEMRRTHSEFMQSPEMIAVATQNLAKFYETDEGKAQRERHGKNHSEIMKKSEKAQSHMKKLNEALRKKREENPVVHRCDICGYIAPKNHKPKLTRHLQTQKHKDNLKKNIIVGTPVTHPLSDTD